MKNFDLSPVGSKIKFQDGQLGDLQEYLNLASITIKAHGGKFAIKLLNSEDAISHIAYALMLADLKWKPNKGMSKNSWRISQGIFAISKYLKRLNKMKKEPENMAVKHMPPQISDPLEELMELEEQNAVLHSLDKSGLKPMEYEIIKMRLWENMTFKQIGQHYKITKQGAQVRFNTAIANLGQIWTKTS